MNEALFTSKSVEWYSQRDLFVPLREAYRITLDTSALPGAQLVDRYFAPMYHHAPLRPHDFNAPDPIGWDALRYSWLAQDFAAWNNPPYGRGIERWVEHAARDSYHYQFQRTLIQLLPVRTDTKWWSKWIKPCWRSGYAEVCFLSGRLVFGTVGAKKTTSAPFPSVLIRWGAGPSLEDVLRGTGFV